MTSSRSIIFSRSCYIDVLKSNQQKKETKQEEAKNTNAADGGVVVAMVTNVAAVNTSKRVIPRARAREPQRSTPFRDSIPS